MEQELLNLANEVRLLFHQLVQSGDTLHEAESITMGMRGVLEYVRDNGATTVPDIARNRGVSRQHIQVLVNGLVAQGAVELVDNPAHKRSSLVDLTREGKQTIQRMKRREQRFFSENPPALSAGELRRARKTLQTFRTALSSNTR